MFQIRVFVSLIGVMLTLNCSLASAIAQQGNLGRYGDRNSTDIIGLLPANDLLGSISNNLFIGEGSPIFNMLRNRTTLGLNVLSGLVKIDRSRELGKPRALSVRVFGIPVYNRGYDQRYPLPSDFDSGSRPGGDEPDLDRGVISGGGGSGNGSGSGSGSAGGDGREEEELPVEPVAK